MKLFVVEILLKNWNTDVNKYDVTCPKLLENSDPNIDWIQQKYWIMSGNHVEKVQTQTFCPS